ncbi:elongator complex protein 6 [Orussus abietinus]|uniref:elongator complex protein 6 n=1 Tax=Orussus abietinus TaxID=222816 RepID=UPI0006262EAC|nr:elongator complex protein 6 [Orussus abietinus]XP_012283670.1 elongator complex protein 6 [Orussus abietinus]
MTDSVCGVLGIDRVDMNGMMTLIEEQHGSDANFLVNSILAGALEKGQGVCLVLFHNTFSHYHNIGMKLGYNLSVLRERGQVAVIEPMSLVSCEIEELGHDSVDADSVNLCERKPKEPENSQAPNSMKFDANIGRKLLFPLRDKCFEVLDSRDSVVIIVDDLSHLFDAQLSLKDVWFVVRYLRSLMEFEPMVSLYIMTHTYKADHDSCQPDMIAIGLKHTADLVVTVQPLASGKANDVSGRMNIRWKVDSVRKKYKWAERSCYLYKLSDRQVRVFPLGTTSGVS